MECFGVLSFNVSAVESVKVAGAALSHALSSFPIK